MTVQVVVGLGSWAEGSREAARWGSWAIAALVGADAQARGWAGKRTVALLAAIGRAHLKSKQVSVCPATGSSSRLWSMQVVGQVLWAIANCCCDHKPNSTAAAGEGVVQLSLAATTKHPLDAVVQVDDQCPLVGFSVWQVHGLRALAHVVNGCSSVNAADKQRVADGAVGALDRLCNNAAVQEWGLRALHAVACRGAAACNGAAAASMDPHVPAPSPCNEADG